MGSQSFIAWHVEIIRRLEKQFSREQIEKALAATGHKDEATTLKWLVSHSGDPDLNKPSSREYILFLCPTGPLLSEVSRFYEQSFNKCGSNGAHALFPHVTLSSFFQIDDARLPKLLDVLESCLNSYLQEKPLNVKLSLQCTNGYIGLFLNEESVEWLTVVLEKITKILERDLEVVVKPHGQQYHLTLAYHFDASKQKELEKLASLIELDTDVRWEFNCYSRATSFVGKQVLLVTRQYSPDKGGELALIDGSYLIAEGDTSHSAWKKGTSFDTGQVGIFPENCTKKAADWRIWAKNFSASLSSQTATDRRAVSNGPAKGVHMTSVRRTKSMPHKKEKSRGFFSRRSDRNGAKAAPSAENKASESVNDADASKTAVGAGSSAMPPLVRQGSWSEPSITLARQSAPLSDRHNSLESNRRHRIELKDGGSDARSNADKLSVSGSLSNKSVSSKVVRSEPRHLYLMRHAERVDLAFGHDWFKTYIDDAGYHRRNLNLPRKIPTRRCGPKDFYLDSPITEIGTFQGRLIGEALRSKGVVFSEVYSSPSLRSVLTAVSVLEGMNDAKTKIRLEPGLFEWLAWCRGTVPNFMSPEEYRDYGVNVDTAYKPVVLCSELSVNEKAEDYYARSFKFVSKVMETATNNVLMVGHSATLDVGSRQLTGHEARCAEELIRVVQRVPFCGLCLVEEQGDKWSLVQAPIPSLIHGQNAGFDWRALLDNGRCPTIGRT